MGEEARIIRLDFERKSFDQCPDERKMESDSGELKRIVMNRMAEVLDFITEDIRQAIKIGRVYNDHWMYDPKILNLLGIREEDFAKEERRTAILEGIRDSITEKITRLGTQDPIIFLYINFESLHRKLLTVLNKKYLKNRVVRETRADIKEAIKGVFN